MTEAASVFKETNKERSNLKNSAFHKKNGSAVSKLGNKRMTWQEIKSKHGPVKTYRDLDSFMTYDEFKLLPPDLKVEYVNSLCDKYKIRVSHISEFLFNMDEKGLMAYLKIFDLYDKCMQGKTREVTPEAIQKFRDDISEWERRKEAAEAIDQEQRNAILGEFITYETFLTLEPKLQADWLNSIITKYNVSKSNIETVLFNKSVNSLEYRLKKAGVYNDIIKCTDMNPARRAPYNEAFRKAVKEWEGKNSMQKDEEAPIVTLKIEKPKKEAKEIAEDILKSIIGEREETPEEPVAVAAEPIKELKPEPIEEPAKEPKTECPEEPKPVMRTWLSEYQDWIETKANRVEKTAVPNYSAAFSANYISESGLDEKQLMALMSLFQNQKVRVSISVEVVE